MHFFINSSIKLNTPEALWKAHSRNTLKNVCLVSTTHILRENFKIIRLNQIIIRNTATMILMLLLTQFFCEVPHCVKSVRIRSYSGPCFPAFRLNTDRNNSEYGHFLRSAYRRFSCFDICLFEYSKTFLLSMNHYIAISQIKNSSSKLTVKLLCSYAE